jgi:hypothetical protein
VDSESRILANKKFLAVWTFRAFAVSQTRFFCQPRALIRDRALSDLSSLRSPATPVRHPTTTKFFIRDRQRNRSRKPRDGSCGGAG